MPVQLPAVHAGGAISFTIKYKVKYKVKYKLNYKVNYKVNYKEQSGNAAIYSCKYPEGTFRTLFITTFLNIYNVNEITDVQRFFWTLDAGGENVTRGWE